MGIRILTTDTTETPGKPAPEPVPPSEPYPDQPPAEGDES